MPRHLWTGTETPEVNYKSCSVKRVETSGLHNLVVKATAGLDTKGCKLLSDDQGHQQREDWSEQLKTKSCSFGRHYILRWINYPDCDPPEDFYKGGLQPRYKPKPKHQSKCMFGQRVHTFVHLCMKDGWASLHISCVIPERCLS